MNPSRRTDFRGNRWRLVFCYVGRGSHSPRKKSWKPLDYFPAKAKLQPWPVSSQDIVDFFLKNMANENLGVICNAHVVHADRSESGALEEKCIELAKMAATAVDFPKTGNLVTMPPDLKPKGYPDFMGKDDHPSYKSEKILGRLHRKIKDVVKEDVPSDQLLCSIKDLCHDPNSALCRGRGWWVEPGHGALWAVGAQEVHRPKAWPRSGQGLDERALTKAQPSGTWRSSSGGARSGRAVAWAKH